MLHKHARMSKSPGMPAHLWNKYTNVVSSLQANERSVPVMLYVLGMSTPHRELRFPSAINIMDNKLPQVDEDGVWDWQETDMTIRGTYGYKTAPMSDESFAFMPYMNVGGFDDDDKLIIRVFQWGDDDYQIAYLSEEDNSWYISPPNAIKRLPFTPPEEDEWWTKLETVQPYNQPAMQPMLEHESMTQTNLRFDDQGDLIAQMKEHKDAGKTIDDFNRYIMECYRKCLIAGGAADGKDTSFLKRKQ